VTCHLAHLTPAHLALNLLAFLVLGSLCEPALRGRYGALLAVAAVAVGAGLFLVHPRLGSYRGLSGIASAQFAALLAARLTSSVRTRRFRELPAPLLAAGLFLVKLLTETHRGAPVFAGSAALAGRLGCPGRVRVLAAGLG
jgi:membrane associated rhomboid family serine protease